VCLGKIMNKPPSEKRVVNPADRYDHEPTPDEDDQLAPDELSDDDLEPPAADGERLQD
jgi:hypothetical protein